MGSERPPLTDEQKEAMEAAFKEVAPIMRAERFEAGFRAGLASSQRAGEPPTPDPDVLKGMLDAFGVEDVATACERMARAEKALEKIVAWDEAEKPHKNLPLEDCARLARAALDAARPKGGR